MREKKVQELLKIINTVQRKGIAVRQHFTIEFGGQQYKHKVFTRKNIFEVYVN